MVIRRFGLTHPFDIFEFVKSIAELHFDAIPFEIDAILVKTPKKPKIILNNLKAKTRQVFTLAHEVGHIFIPWHVGSTEVIIDNEVGDSYYYDDETYEIESEANEFASEFLLPTEWILSLIQKDERLFDVVISAKKMGISSTVLFKRMRDFIKSDIVLIEVDKNSFIVNSCRGQNSPFSSLYKGAKFSQDNFTPNSFEISETSWVANRIVYIKFLPIDSRIALDDPRDSRQILLNIFKSYSLNIEEQSTLTKQINGTIGSCFNSSRISRLSLFTIMKHKFANREEFLITKHTDFDLFLRKKYEEMKAKHKDVIV